MFMLNRGGLPGQGGRLCCFAIRRGSWPMHTRRSLSDNEQCKGRKANRRTKSDGNTKEEKLSGNATVSVEEIIPEPMRRSLGLVRRNRCKDSGRSRRYNRKGDIL